MNYRHTQQVKSFFYGQYFASGLRITLGILLPSLLLGGLDKLETGLMVSLGALYVSITDHPGPIKHRKNGMVYANLFIFLTALLTGLIYQHAWLLSIEILLLCFIFGMFANYGARASAIGTAALLMMISSMHLNTVTNNFIITALLSLCGGLWYMFLSLSLNQIRPYRHAQQVLGECILEVADYLQMKADFYHSKTPVETLYKKLVIQQITVNQQQNDVRQLLFTTRKRVKETMKSGRLLIMIFINIIDLFEQTMSTHLDYSEIRERYSSYNILPAFRNLIYKLALALDNLGYALINNERPAPLVDLNEDLHNLKSTLDALEEKNISVLVLKKALINARNLSRLIEHIYNYFRADQLPFLSKTEEADLTKFVSHQDFDWHIFKNNLTLKSGVFRHSLRLALTGLTGYLIALFLNTHHSYWILIAVLVILKPDFGLTKERNYGRVVGTIGGGLIGAVIILLLKDDTARLILMVIFMVLAFSFNRTKYVVSVLFSTAFILILFSFIYRTSNLEVTLERVLYTLIGSALAFMSSYFIFPHWESAQIKPYLSAILKANLTYFQKIISRFGEQPVSIIDFKLARKDMYVQTAHLGAAFQRILNEPKSKQESTAYLNEFVVMNHMLSSYLASLSSTFEEDKAPELISYDHIKSVRKTKFLLQEAIKHIEHHPFEIDFGLPKVSKEKRLEENADMEFIGKQLRLIKKAASDIEKLSEKLEKTIY